MTRGVKRVVLWSSMVSEKGLSVSAIIRQCKFV